MELSKAYSEINRLLEESGEQRIAFKEAATKVYYEGKIAWWILHQFAELPKTISFQVKGKQIKPFGEFVISFMHENLREECNRLKKMNTEELEKLVNDYAAEELQIK